MFITVSKQGQLKDKHVKYFYDILDADGQSAKLLQHKVPVSRILDFYVLIKKDREEIRT